MSKLVCRGAGGVAILAGLVTAGLLLGGYRTEAGHPTVMLFVALATP